MKLLIETTGSFMLLDQTQPEASAQAISHQYPTVVVSDHFVGSRAAAGQIKILAQLNDSATNDEFLNYIADCKGAPDAILLAVESFKSAFALNAAPKAPEVPEDGLLRPDLTGLNQKAAKNALEEYAFRKFDVELDRRRPLDDLIAEVDALEAAPTTEE